MNYINALGEKRSKNDEALAWKDINSQLQVIYERKPEQIKLLIEELDKSFKAGNELFDSKHLTEEYWVNARCARYSGSCSGSCKDNKNCRACSSGGMSTCCCLV